MAQLTNDFTWSKSRHEKFEECLRAYYYQYYGSWGGWEAAHGSEIRELYVLKKLSSGPTVGKPSRRSRELFFTACYDLDRFRAFVSSAPFAQLYDIPAEEMRAILSDDLALLQFAFRFLRQTLFGEETIAMRPEAVAARRERASSRAPTPDDREAPLSGA